MAGAHVTAAGETAHLVDFSQIDALLSAAGRDGVNAIMDAFWRSSDQLIERLRIQIGCEDFSEAARTAHALKGSALNVGASLLAGAARAIETACMATDAISAGDALCAIEAAYERTRAVMTDRIAAA